MNCRFPHRVRTTVRGSETVGVMHSITIGTGKPILLIHGFAVDHRLLLPLEEVFVRRAGWERTYIDLPGFGRTPAGPEIDGSDAVAEVLVDFAKERFGSRRFAVLGMSYGGYLARHVVAEFGAQVDGVALIAPVAQPGSDRTLPPRTVLREDPGLLGRLDPADARDYQEMAVVQSEDNWRKFEESVLPGLRAQDLSAAARIQSSYSLSSVPEERFGTFDGPGVMITGRQDHVVGHVDQIGLLQHYPHMAFAILDGAGHNVHLDRHAETGALLDGWLDRMQSSPP